MLGWPIGIFWIALNSESLQLSSMATGVLRWRLWLVLVARVCVLAQAQCTQDTRLGISTNRRARNQPRDSAHFRWYWPLPVASVTSVHAAVFLNLRMRDSVNYSDARNCTKAKDRKLMWIIFEALHWVISCTNCLTKWLFSECSPASSKWYTSVEQCGQCVFWNHVLWKF